MSTRSRCQGVAAIARFNWPFYAMAAFAVLASFAGMILISVPGLRLVCFAVLLMAAYFVVGSLGVSHLIYDRSDLYRWRWLDRALGDVPPRVAVFCHSGFDESSGALRALFAKTKWLVLDHFDESRMTEASIRRARKLFPPTPGTWPAPFDQWPIVENSADVVFGVLAIHEFRSELERSAWFFMARRCLRRGGRVVLVEHLRDFANFLAFGPGFLHFHSRESWRRAWEVAGLRATDEFGVTPWVRVFVLTAS